MVVREKQRERGGTAQVRSTRTPSYTHRKARKETLERLGENIRAFRTSAQWSQEELAAQAGLGRAHIGDIERACHNARVSTLEAIADAFGVTIAQLFQGEGAQRGPKKPPR
jgi:ribosome-binding protein aMBF1 (putative translation factor)